MKKFFRSKTGTALLFVLAVALLTAGSIGGTRAVLNIESAIYESQIELTDIGVSLTENGEVISRRDYVQRSDGIWTAYTGDLITKMVEDAGDSELLIGKRYNVEFGAKNTGNIPEYARVTIYRYWVDSNGRKLPYGWFNGSGTKRLDLNPELIQIHFCNEDLWTVDEGAPTAKGERIVLYYNGILSVGEEKIFADGVTINSDIAKIYNVRTETADGVTRTIYTYAYDGLGAVLEMQVDAVQTHNADSARTSAWGLIGVN